VTRAARGPVTAAVAVALAALLGACSAGTYAATSTTPTTTAATPTPTSAPSTTVPDCGDPRQSYDPLPSLTGGAPDQAVAGIRNSGRLKVGVSADSLLLASRNPFTGQIEGFDIDIAKEVAKAIFGDPNKIELVVITAADRLPVLQKDSVDLVVRNMTMNCDRWQSIAFSSQYYQSGLKILVRKGSDVTSLAGLSGQKVCAPNGTSSLAAVRATAGVVAVGAANHTTCLVRFQNGDVDAIAGDDTVLAGLVAQDPYAFVPKMDALTSEPYGIGVNKDKKDLVRYVNRVLDTMKTNGRWQQIYNAWFAEALGPAPSPPPSVYGRQ
jgi:polar amino acid transport system substrate-binding protein